MNEAEKERLIKKDIESIENRVRHAFNQGYEMGMKDREKLNCTDCIIEKSDSFIKSCLEIPNTCGDAVSRQEVLDLMRGLTRWCVRSEDGKFNNVGLLYDDVMFGIDGLPSVTPQQRTGRWIAQDIHNCHTSFKCSECDYTFNFMHLYGKPTADYTYCPMCGSKMEVEE